MCDDPIILQRAREESVSHVPALDAIAPRDSPSIELTGLLHHIFHEQAFVLDVRSEAEFEESHLPSAVSFPILNNQERHEVGLLYKQVSPKHAVKRALQYATPKTARLVERVRREAGVCYVYCFRGGGRSRYVVEQLQQAGLKACRLEGGHKAYRREVVRKLYHSPFPELTILKGSTGCGKSRVLDQLSGEYACLHLEEYARNTASAFGRIPYQLRGRLKGVSQKAFEDCIFRDTFHNPLPILNKGLLVESESRRVGSANLPPALFQTMLKSKTIELHSCIEVRVQRIYEDYVGDGGEGTPLIERCLESLKPYVARSQLQTWRQMIASNRIRDLLRSLLQDYYDVRYKGSYKPSAHVVNTDDLHQAVFEIVQIMKE